MLREATLVELKTARLMLRPPQRQDFERYADLRANEAACRFIGGPCGRHEAWRTFLQLGGSWFLQAFGPFSVLDQTSGRWLGYAGPWYPQGWPCPEVIYALHPDCQGLGLAREALAVVTDWAFTQQGWENISHFIHPDNIASQRLAAHLGAQNQGPGQLPEPWQAMPFDIWRLSRQQWQSHLSLHQALPGAP